MQGVAGMKEDIEQINAEIIDVVDEFDYSTQQDSYNKRFKEWRRNQNNPYAYNFVLDKREQVFVDGQGFVDESAAESENAVLGRILREIGIALLAAILIETVLFNICIMVLDVLGFDIHSTFFNFVVYGGKTEVVITLMAFSFLKLAVPIGMIQFRFKVPAKLEYPHSLSDSGELAAAIAAAMVVSVVSGIPAAYSEGTKEIYNFFKTYAADMSVWGQEEFLIYTIFDVIAVSVLSELLFRGGMFTALRQFGDYYAIFITSVLAGLLTQNFRTMLCTILISVVSSIGMLRSGTIFTAIAVRITYKLYLLTLAVIEMSPSENMSIRRNLFMAAFFLAGLLVFLIVFVNNRERRTRHVFANRKTHLPTARKLALPCITFPLYAVAFICLLAGFLKIAA